MYLILANFALKKGRKGGSYFFVKLGLQLFYKVMRFQGDHVCKIPTCKC